MIVKLPIFRLQKLLGRSVDIYSVVFNDERESHPQPPHRNWETVLNLRWGGGLFRKKRQASIIEGDFVKKKCPIKRILKISPRK